MIRESFGSDNNSGVHEKVLEAIVRANKGHQIAYGDDPYTRKAKQIFRKIFGKDSDVYFVYGGTGANVLSLANFVRSHQAIICASTAHINVDECGAPEKFTGSKLLTVDTSDGKLRVEDIKKKLHGRGFEHSVQPGVVSLTQATELGTVYSISELKEIVNFAHSSNLFVHMDGARLANACASLGVSPAAITTKLGVDVFTFGGTKNGMMYGEAIVFRSKKLSREFKYTRKQGMQLASKMRFIAAQFIALLEDDLWLENAMRANKMARLLESELSSIPSLYITQKVQANAVFALLPLKCVKELRKKYFFYVWNDEPSSGQGNSDVVEVRFMTSFDTTERAVRLFAGDIRSIMSKYKSLRQPGGCTI